MLPVQLQDVHQAELVPRWLDQPLVVDGRPLGLAWIFSFASVKQTWGGVFLFILHFFDLAFIYDQC